MPTITFTDEQYDSLTVLLEDLLDTLDREDYSTRADYFAQVSDLNDLLDTLTKGK